MLIRQHVNFHNHAPSGRLTISWTTSQTPTQTRTQTEGATRTPTRTISPTQTDTPDATPTQNGAYIYYDAADNAFRIATGEYDGYIAEPRAGEWDIAAGHAILENAGGSVTDFDGNKILYGKENFKNPSLILKRSNNLKWVSN